MPNINDAFPSRYLKASDLQGQEPVVVISHVEYEEVGRERDRKAVVYFQGKSKGLVLNKTNANKIIQLANTPITEEWAGVSIKLYATETEFSGETVECIRVKAAAPARPAATALPPTARTVAPPQVPQVPPESDIPF